MGIAKETEELPDCLRSMPLSPHRPLQTVASGVFQGPVAKATQLSPPGSFRGSSQTDCLQVSHSLLPSPQKETKTSGNLMSFAGGLRGAGRGPVNTGITPGPFRASNANRKIMSPNSFQGSQGGRTECSRVLPADQAGPEQGKTPTVHRGKGN